MTAPVLLVRHAEAEGGRGGRDAERRLTPGGRDAFLRLLRALGPRLEVRRILSSPFVRARQTAEILAQVTGAPVEIADELASGHSGGRELLALAREAGAASALVGHNPEVAEAIALVSGNAPAVFPGTVAALELGEAPPSLSWIRSP